jgi:predicted nucleotide-binding protein (sugar kinase/HSP70/actin superfamily)
MTENDGLDTLLDELSGFNFPPITVPRTRETRKTEITEDNVTDFVIKSSEALINAGLDSVSDLRDYIVQGQNPDEIDALASLITSTTGAIEALNKMVLLKKKNEATKELKIMELENRKEVAALLPGMNTVNNTNVVIASRSEMFKALIQDEIVQKVDQLEDIQVIDASITEVSE